MLVSSLVKKETALPPFDCPIFWGGVVSVCVGVGGAFSI